MASLGDSSVVLGFPEWQVILAGTVLAHFLSPLFLVLKCTGDHFRRELHWHGGRVSSVSLGVSSSVSFAFSRVNSEQDYLNDSRHSECLLVQAEVVSGRGVQPIWDWVWFEGRTREGQEEARNPEQVWSQGGGLESTPLKGTAAGIHCELPWEMCLNPCKTFADHEKGDYLVQNHQKLEVWDVEQGGRMPLISMKVHSRPVR